MEIYSSIINKFIKHVIILIIDKLKMDKYIFLMFLTINKNNLSKVFLSN